MARKYGVAGRAIGIGLLLSSITLLKAAECADTRPTSNETPERYRAFAMSHQGDASRGKLIFNDQQLVACARCHVVDGRGGNVGPDLSTIGDKFGRQDLIDSILHPSATIAVGYSTTIVRTKSGERYDGIIKDITVDQVALMGADGKLRRIPKVDISQRRTTDISLMPEGLHNALTLQGFADLIAYLAELKFPASATAAHHGMPAVIAELAKPVRLLPFNDEADRFAHPVWFQPLPGVADAFVVVEHETGRIWVLRKSGGRETKTVFLDTGRFQPGTRGLLGMTFHPQYRTNRRYFIVKHQVEAGHFATHLFEGRAAASLTSDSGQPLREVLRLDEATNVHYGGCLQFGPDGYLYVGMGDSGPQGDPQGHAQSLQLLLGKMLRIDVDHQDRQRSYSIPPDNPFVDRSNARPEIWAWGLREPWRFSFDPLTHDLWVGDVGQDLFEEVDIVRRGENYGWNVYEGFEPFSNRYRHEGQSYVPPVFAYTRRYGASVTGGYVYRGDPRSSFYGVYIFGDYQNSRIFGLTQENRVLTKVRLLLAHAPEHVVSFGRDRQGGLYVVGYEGTIYRLDLSQAKFE